jgi:hypothetical protein
LEWGDNSSHFTKITVDAMKLIIPGGAAALQGGKLLYTLPAGNIVVKTSYLKMLIDGVAATNDAKTPEVGIGTTTATAATATLGTTLENILEGGLCLAPDCAGTLPAVGTDTVDLVIKAADAHTIYLNIADTWAGADTGGLLATGTVILEWAYLD